MKIEKVTFKGASCDECRKRSDEKEPVYMLEVKQNTCMQLCEEHFLKLFEKMIEEVTPILAERYEIK